jgi:hypothetical protein
MSEITFLIELLLNHKLTKTTKEVIAARIKEIEDLRHPPEKCLEVIKAKASPSAVPEGQIAQTPAAQEALRKRTELMQSAGKTSRYPVIDAG